MAGVRQQTLHAAKAEIDQLGVERLQAFQDVACDVSGVEVVHAWTSKKESTSF
jgi:hypothetical protein